MGLGKLLPFKHGAFYIASKLDIPIIPIVISKIYNRINFNTLNNGLVIVEMLPPININKLKKKSYYEIAQYCRFIMNKKIKEINKEISNI